MIEKILDEERAKCQLYSIYQRTDGERNYCIFSIFFNTSVKCPFVGKPIDEFNNKVYFCKK